jgi:hypothetical protein
MIRKRNSGALRPRRYQRAERKAGERLKEMAETGERSVIGPALPSVPALHPRRDYQ